MKTQKNLKRITELIRVVIFLPVQYSVVTKLGTSFVCGYLTFGIHFRPRADITV